MSSFPIVLFGAFDRHNLGDFLLGHAAARQAAPRPCLFAGLRAVDFTAVGGFPVERLAAVVAGWPQRFGSAPLELVHVGGEILDTDAWEAAVMLLDRDGLDDVIARLDKDLPGRTAWAAEFLGTGSSAPYVFGKADLPPGSRLEFRGVGGVGLDRRDESFVLPVAHALRSADKLSARDNRTRQALSALGIDAHLVPDPVSGLAPWLLEQAASVPLSITADYIAFQCAATFGDDRTLNSVAAALNRLGLPVLAFQAGAAPWHDDLAVYGRLLQRLKVPARILESLSLRDLCGTIAHSRLCLASSLHALLVAGACGVPAIGLERRSGEGEKIRAYAETWGGFQVVAPEGI